MTACTHDHIVNSLECCGPSDDGVVKEVLKSDNTSVKVLKRDEMTCVHDEVIVIDDDHSKESSEAIKISKKIRNMAKNWLICSVYIKLKEICCAIMSG